MSPRELAVSGIRLFVSAFSRETRGVHEAAYLLAFFTLFSQVLALVRDRLFAGTFGAGEVLDVYFAAFRIPDLLFATAASLLSLYALLPVLARLEEQHAGLAVAFLRQALWWFFVAMGCIAGVLYVLVPVLSPLVAPGITDAAARADLVLLMRILLLQPILLGVSNALASFTQLRHRFLLYAISPLLYNLGIIAGVLLLYPVWGIAGLGWGVVFGALLHMLVQAPFFAKEPHSAKLPVPEFRIAVREVLRLSVPRTLALASGQFSLLILVAMASLFAPGSVAVFTLAWNLQAVPLSIIGVSYSVAAFPTLARLFASGATKEFLASVEAALRHIIFWAIPATVLIVVLRAQLVRTILGFGAFDWAATRLTAAALALFAFSLAAQCIVLLVARAYYAAGKTREPLRLAVLSVLVSVGGAVLFVGLFHSHSLTRAFLEASLRVLDLPGTTVLMLALGFALGSVAQASAGLFLMRRDFGLRLSSVRRLVFQSAGASIIGGAAAYGALAAVGAYADINTTFGIFAQGFVGGGVGLCVITAMLALLRNRELSETYAALRRRFKDTPPVVLEPTNIS